MSLTIRRFATVPNPGRTHGLAPARVLSRPAALDGLASGRIARARSLVLPASSAPPIEIEPDVVAGATWDAVLVAYTKLAETLPQAGRKTAVARLRQTIAGNVAAGDPTSQQRARLTLAAATIYARALQDALGPDQANNEQPNADQLALARTATQGLVELYGFASDRAGRLAVASAAYANLDRLNAELAALLGPIRKDWIPVWANESHAGGPSGLQPVSASHFHTGVATLSGPRVRIEMPEEAVTALDDTTFLPSETVASHLADVEPNPDGSFAPALHTHRGATTAFYAATTVIDAGERWAGTRLSWGNNGTLRVVPYRFVSQFFNAYFDGGNKVLNLGALGHWDNGELKGFTGLPIGWKKEVHNLALDGAHSRDIVAHEAGHALLNALKPGLFYGTGMALNEGIADTIAVLTAFEDPDVVGRVLRETGGDLQKLNEASRVAEFIGHAVHRFKDDDPTNDDKRYMRALSPGLTIAEAEIDRDADSIPGMGISPKRDPHRLGQIVSGLHYDVFVALYQRERQGGATGPEAVARARDATGRLVLYATRHVGEHQASMRDWALALLRVESSALGPSSTALLRHVLEKRGLVDDGETLPAAAPMPQFVLPPTVTSGDEILARFEQLETAQLERAEAGEDVSVLLRHNRFVPSLVKIPAGDLKLRSDQTFGDGVRVVRLSYATSLDSGYGEPVLSTAYMSLVFGSDGRLVDFQRDEPALAAW